MEFEFDPAKSEANKLKHGLDFVAAQALWDDPMGLEVGPFHHPEVRLGWVARLDGRVWMAVFTRRARRIRLISARRARKDEVMRYEQTNR